MTDANPANRGNGSAVVCPSCHMESSKWDRTCRFCGEELHSITENSQDQEASTEREYNSDGFTAPISPDREPDKLRLCPSCRMQISILAVKCRYCGEEVGRPRAEQRSLTIRDLGGETVMHVAPSKSVIDALQAFREEEHATQLERNTPAIKRKKDNRTPPAHPGATAQLDASHASLASIAMESKPFAYVQESGGPSGWFERLRLPLYITAGVLALCLAGFGLFWYLGRPAPEMGVPENLAKSMLSQGVAIVETLKVAEQYHRRYPSDESLAVLGQARDRLRAEVDRLINADPFKMECLREASALASDAQRIDPSTGTVALVDEVAREVRAYCVMLVDVDTKDPPAAQVRVTNTDRTVSEIKVKAGETFYDNRFKVEAVSTNSIYVVDSMRNNRRLRITRTAGMIPM